MAGNANGHNLTKSVVGALAGTEVLGVVAAGMLAVANDARIAINVAAQHGNELLLLRGEVVALRQELVGRTADRFTSKDHAQFERYIIERIDRLDRELKELEVERIDRLERELKELEERK